MQQAARVSDYTAFFWLGRLVEYGPTADIFTSPEGQAHRGLHHGPLRLDRERTVGDSWNGTISRRSSPRSGTSCSRWAAWSRSASPRDPVADPPQEEEARAHHRHRQGDQRPPDRHRRPLPEAARDADAARDRPAADHVGDEDQRRPGARRRPGRQHRRERPGAAAAPAGQAADRHPAHGGDRREDGAGRARRLRQARRRARARRAAARRRGRRAQGPGVPRAARPT